MIHIIILSGLIASGKSSIGRTLSTLFNEKGYKAKFFDIDYEINSIDPNDSFEEDSERQPGWFLAKESLAKKCMELSDDNYKYIIISAPFFSDSDLASFTIFLEFPYSIDLFFLDADLATRKKRSSERAHWNDVEELELQELKVSMVKLSDRMIVLDTKRPVEEIINEIFRRYIP